MLSFPFLVASAGTAAAPSPVLGEVELAGLIGPFFPRFMFGSPLRRRTSSQLEARQAVIDCPVGESSCLAINATGCCANDNYCYVNPAGDPKCCAFGSRCDDPCPLSAYRCTLSYTATCCDRPCPAPSGHLCPQSVGGSCCSVGSVCLVSNSCSKTINPATINTVTPSPTGCNSNQFSCPASEGGGCCVSGQTCTGLGTQLLCVANGGGSSTARPTVGGGALDTHSGSPLTNAGSLIPSTTSTSIPQSSSSGLTPGAKAGIGIGVPLAILLVLLLPVVYILRRRRLRRNELQKPVRPPLPSRTAFHSSASTPGAHLHHFNSSDYIGAHPQPGPYTTLHTSAANAVGMTTYNPQLNATAVQQDASNRGAVPISPQGPADITTPVEMAESEASLGTPLPGMGGSPREPAGRVDYFSRAPMFRQSRVRELDGESSPVAELPGTPVEKH